MGALGTVVLPWGNDVSLSRLFWSLGLVVVVLEVVQVLVGAGGGKRAPGRVSAVDTGAVTGVRRTAVRSDPLDGMSIF